MFIIDKHSGIDWYSFFYLISSIFTFILLLYLGWKKGYPLLSWSLILFTGALFFIIGTKLVTFRREEWALLFREGLFPLTTNRSALGGLLFAILGIELTKSWLKIREFVLDTYVLAVPLGLAIQKPGCLLAGCCFGIPTSLPWGVQYTTGTSVHHHWISGLTPVTEMLTPSLHPVPLYEILVYLLIFVVLIRSGHFLRKPGSRFLLALTLLTFSRFFIEFLRDPVGSVIPGTQFLGLKIIQWVLLVAGIILGSLLVRKLKRGVVRLENYPETNGSMRRKYVLLLLLALLLWAVKDGFSPAEMLVMNIKLLPAVVLFGMDAWIRFTVPRFRVAGIAILNLPLLIMGQSVPTTASSTKHFHSFGTGFTGGYFGETARYNEHEGACGPTYNRKYFEESYAVGSLNYSLHFFTDGYNRITYGATLYGGVVHEHELDQTLSSSHYLLGLHPYFDANARWIGGGIGLNIGRLRYIPTDPFTTREITSGLKTFPMLPSVKLRVGPYDIIDLEYKFLDEFPTQMPLVRHQLSIGTGFGLTNGSGFRIGVAPPEECYFAGISAVIKEHYMLQAKYIYYDSYQFPKKSHFISVGLNYRLSPPK